MWKTVEKPVNTGFLPTIPVENSVENVDSDVESELNIQVTVYNSYIPEAAPGDILRNYENDACVIGLSMLYCM